MKFAAFGRTQLLYHSILACRERGHDLVLLGTSPAAPEYTKTEYDFEQLAKSIGCPYFCDPAINRERYRQIAQASEAEIAISVNWLTLIQQPMLEQFAYGVINAHAGDLPRYRGNACPNWAILASEEQVVVTLHQMAVDLDAGPILLQRSFPLTSDTYIGDFYDFAELTIPEMFAETLDGLANGQLTPQEQPTNPDLSLRCFPRLPTDGEIDWSQSAEQIARLVRASAKPFAGAYTHMNGEKLIVWGAHAEEYAQPHLGVSGQVIERRIVKGEVAVLTSNGVLVLESVELYRDGSSVGRTKASRAIESLRIRLGLTLSDEILSLRQEVSALREVILDLAKSSGIRN